MVKITIPKQTKKEQKHQEIELENITKEQLLKILEGKQENKKKQLTIKITTNTVNQIRTYAKEQNTTVTNVLQTITSEYFKNKSITRDVITPNTKTYIAIPVEQEARQKYIKQKINLLLTDPKKDNYGNITAGEFDKFKIQNNKADLQYTQLKEINNLLDKYDSEEKCYYSNYNAYNYDNPLLNHLGILIYEHKRIILDNTDTSETGEHIPCDILLIHSYNGEVQEVRSITRQECYNIASDVNNKAILNYLDNYPQHEYITNVHEDILDKKALQGIILKRTQQLGRVKHENKKLQEDKKELQRIITQLQTGKKIDTQYPDVIQAEINNYLETIESLKEENSKLRMNCNRLQYEIRDIENEQELKNKEIDEMIDSMKTRIRQTYNK
ncbi:MAG: coiled-coil domain-containing protein [Methanosphaera sp.]